MGTVQHNRQRNWLGHAGNSKVNNTSELSFLTQQFLYTVFRYNHKLMRYTGWQRDEYLEIYTDFMLHVVSCWKRNWDYIIQSIKSLRISISKCLCHMIYVCPIPWNITNENAHCIFYLNCQVYMYYVYMCCRWDHKLKISKCYCGNEHHFETWGRDDSWETKRAPDIK